VTKEVVERARKGEGRLLIECLTYRLGAHSTSDDWKKYRSAEEVDEWRKKDPLIRTRLYLEKEGSWNKSSEEKLRKELENIVAGGIPEQKKSLRRRLKRCSRAFLKK